MEHSENPEASPLLRLFKAPDHNEHRLSQVEFREGRPPCEIMATTQVSRYSTQGTPIPFQAEIDQDLKVV